MKSIVCKEPALKYVTYNKYGRKNDFFMHRESEQGKFFPMNFFASGFLSLVDCIFRSLSYNLIH